MLGIDLVVRACLSDGNAIHHMMVISSVESTDALKVRVESILTTSPDL